ncbi:hypothetical protein [Mucilaginibacter sp. 3215]|uniref:hypothetical protein n=1 Tax=Mucilaginibacter sp. 3215 TaxID=3373912 RepID=UPI003D223422
MNEVTDLSDIDKMLDAVLSVYQIPEKEIEYIYIPVYQPTKAISEAVRDFNPEKHVVITKEEFDVATQLKATLQDVKEDVQFIKSAYTRSSEPKIKKSIISDEEKSIARKAKLLKIPRIR